MAWLVSFSHLEINLDVSPTGKSIDVEFCEFCGFVNDLGEEGARLICREVAWLLHFKILDGVNAAWLEQDWKYLWCGCAAETIKVPLLYCQCLKASLLLDEFAQVLLHFAVGEPRFIATKIERS